MRLSSRESNNAIVLVELGRIITSQFSLISKRTKKPNHMFASKFYFPRNFISYKTSQAVILQI